MDLLSLSAKIMLDTSGYEEGLDDAEEEAETASKSIAERFKDGAKSVSKGVMAVGAGAALVGGAMIKNTASVAAYGDNIDKMSQKMGVSTDFYQEWDAVLQHSGTSMDSMKTTFKTLADASAETSKTQEAAFEALGLSMDEVHQMGQEELFETVIERLQGMEEGADRTAIAADLLGKGAVEMGALLNTSAEDTQAMKEKVHELGGVMSEDAVKASAAFQDNVQDLTTGFTSMKNELGVALMPALNDLMSLVIEHMPEIQSTMETVFGGISTAIGWVVEGIGWLSTEMNTEGSTINLIWEGVKASVGFVADAVSGLVGLVVGGVKWITESLGEVVDFAEDVAETAGQNVAFFGSGEVDPVALMAYQDSLMAAETDAETTSETITDTVDTMVDEASTKMEEYSESMQTAFEESLKAAEENGTATEEAMSFLTEALQGGAVEGLEEFRTAFTETAAEVQGGAETTYTAILNALSKGASAFRSNTSSAKSSLVSNYNAIRTTVSNTMSSILQGTNSGLTSLESAWRRSLQTIERDVATTYSSIQKNMNISGSVQTGGVSGGNVPVRMAKAMHTPYLLTERTSFGGGLEAGEAGREMMLGENTFYDAIDRASGGSQIAPLLVELNNTMNQVLKATQEGKNIYVGKKRVTDAIADTMDSALGANMRRRGATSV